MKNELKYYYGLDIKNYKQKNNTYFFVYKGYSYIFTIYDRGMDEINDIYNVSLLLHQKGIYCHEIILNNNNDILTIINNKKYILMKNYISSSSKISLNEIINFSINTRDDWNFSAIKRIDWKMLWLNKVQNIEYQVSQFGQSDNTTMHGFSYYSGLVENDIQLLNEFINSYDVIDLSIAHKRITYNTTLDEFYNPLNFIIDYSVRDVSEYLKSKIIAGVDVIEEYLYCIKLPVFSQIERQLFFVRCLYPSYYLDAYEQYFFQNDNNYRKKVELDLLNNTIYENNIKKMYELSATYINNFPYINWLVPE